MIRRSARPQRGFTILDNDVLQDSELSFRALGVLAYVLSKPDNWGTRAEQLATSHTEGRDAVYTALNELEEAGYLARVKRQNEKGRWVTDSVVYDRPVGREIPSITSQDRTDSWETGVGSTGVGFSGTTTSTEEEVLRTTPRRRGATSSQRPKSRRNTQPDETPDADEAPALGADPKRKSTAEADVVAAERGTSGRGLAIRLRDGLAARSTGTTSSKTVDVGLLAKRLNQLHQKGMARDVQEKCVELYVANPQRYTRGSATKGWTGFLEAMPMLEADAENHVRADAGGKRFGGAYAGITE